MIEYIVGYGSIAIVVIWLSFMIIRARVYKKTSLSNCDMNCATCRARCDEEEKQNHLQANTKKS